MAEKTEQLLTSRYAMHTLNELSLIKRVHVSVVIVQFLARSVLSP